MEAVCGCAQNWHATLGRLWKYELCLAYQVNELLTFLLVGLNRLVQGLVGLQDIRETVLFPRDAIRLSP